MKEILIVIGIALILFLIFIYLDKGKNILKKIKKIKIKKKKPVKEKKEKPVKEKKIKEQKVQDQTEKVDYDTKIKEENIEYGKEAPSAMQDIQTTGFPEKLFVDKNAEQEEIDLDKMFEELRRKESSSEKNDETPNFDDMSIEELDSYLEQSFEEEIVSPNSRNALDIYGYEDNMSGEELGRVLRNLPKQIKILLLSDILKRKF